MIELKEFKKITKRATDKRNHSILHSWGIRDAFLFLQKNKWFNIGQVLKEAQFQQIIRQVNTLLAFELMKGNEVRFPKEMGSLELRSFKSSPTIKDGKLIINNPINWDATLELWYEDEEARTTKKLVYFTGTSKYRLFYNRAGSDYNNKSFYQFRVNRDIKRIINKHIKQGKITDLFLS